MTGLEGWGLQEVRLGRKRGLLNRRHSHKGDPRELPCPLHMGGHGVKMQSMNQEVAHHLTPNLLAF
jgi:hypothetical protein